MSQFLHFPAPFGRYIYFSQHIQEFMDPERLTENEDLPRPSSVVESIKSEPLAEQTETSAPTRRRKQNRLVVCHQPKLTEVGSQL